MNIPPLQANGELPPGEHPATLDEIEQVYGSSNDRRRLLMRGLRDAAAQFAQAGVKAIWINGSFVTDKNMPNDIDGCWEYNPTVVIDKLDPVFLMRSRDAMKNKYGLDFFIANIIEAGSGLPFPKFFQVNREGEPKGILVVMLGETYHDYER
jgi:hypothetical protein